MIALSPEATQRTWEQGRLKFKLQPKQKEAYDKLKGSPASEIFFLLCHRGFGKTYLASIIGLETARKEIEGNILIISSTLKKLRTIVKPVFDEILRDCPQELKPTYNAQDSYYQFPNGIRVHLLAAEGGHIQDARGIHKVILVILDEVAFFGDESDSFPLDHVVTSILNPMFIRTKSTPRMLMMTTPPTIPGHPCKAFYEQAKANNCLAEFDIYNSDIPKEKIEELKKRTLSQPSGKLAWDNEMLLKWVVDQSRLIVPEWKKEYVQEVERDEFFPFYHKYHALDTGVRDFTIDIMGYYDFKKAKLIIEDEILLKGAEVRTDTLANEIKRKEKELAYEKIYRRIGDNNNLIVLQDLSGIHGLPYLPTTKDELFAMVNELRLWVNAGRIIVRPNAVYTRGCLENGIWDKAHKEFGRSATFGHFDALAALCYLIRHIDVNTNPIPKNYGLDIQKHHIPPGVDKSEHYKLFEKALKVPAKRSTMEDWRERVA